MKQKHIFLVLAILSFCIYGCTKPKANENYFTERAKVNLRAVGNQLLLSQKDSLSLILPITEVDDSKYRISFENKLSFEPNTLVKIIKDVFGKTVISKKYRVEVLEDTTKEVAYSYQINTDNEKTLIPCAGRLLPEKKYLIEVVFLDKRISKFNYNHLFYVFIPLIIGVFYSRFSKKKKPTKILEKKHEKHTIIGSFQFFPEQNKLVKKSTEIALSKKECELLEIFVANPNQIIKREDLTKKVWEDNGVFVGRSLDTYISKLRKKLKEDDSIKLTNVHGIGYKLEVIPKKH